MPRKKSQPRVDKEIIRESLGLAVRLRRNVRRMTQEELCKAASCDRSYVSQVERGIKNCTIQSLWKLAVALDVKPSQLLLQAEALAAGAQSAAS